MNMKVLRLYTHWNVSEAYSLLALIDDLREEILEHYGDDIARMLQDAAVCADDRQLELPFTDLSPF